MTGEYDEEILERIRESFPSGESAKVLERVLRLLDAFSRITGDKVKDLYATGVHEKGGENAAPKDLLLLSEKHVMLVESFEEPLSFTLFSTRKRISSIRITAEDYDFDGDYESSRESSRLRVACTTSDGVFIEREAWGPYCAHLSRLIRLWMLPNLE